MASPSVSIPQIHLHVLGFRLPASLAILALTAVGCLSNFDSDGVELKPDGPAADAAQTSDADDDAGPDAPADVDEQPDVTIEGCIDEDGDGSAGTGRGCDQTSETFDCDDTRGDVNPDAHEVCDGVDNDCDGAIDEDVNNGCGGCEPLDEVLGQSCGECGQVVCNGINATRCGDGLGNACGGCEVLSGIPLEPCGACGTYACTGINVVECQDQGFDSCGGCSGLTQDVGDSCGACGDGTWACAATDFVCQGSSEPQIYYRDSDLDGYGVEEVSAVLCAPEAPYTAVLTGDCDDGNSLRFPGNPEVCDGRDNDCDGEIDNGVLNGCGGCAILAGTPGNPCGTCGEGVWECRGAEAISCVGPGINPCGGCDPLTGEPGDSCESCGTLVCDGSEALICDNPEVNACGVCGTLPAEPGSPCGACGIFACQGATVVCDDPGANDCNGCSALEDTPGQPCGSCGTVACQGVNATVCEDPGTNECGGCGPMTDTPGQPCGACGTFACDDSAPGTVVCTDPGHNTCGGCAVLPNEPGTSCGSCGNYVCAPGNNAVACDGDNVNACGGCAPLDPPTGVACGQCGLTVCDTPDATTCSDPGTNGCGGCSTLDDPPGTHCEVCGQYACLGEDNTICDDPGANACGGCAELPHTPDTTCDVCGLWTCDASGNDLTCEDPGANACGGCGPLPNPLGSPCGDCGTWRCDIGLIGELTCDDPGFTRYFLDHDRDTYGSMIDPGVLACAPTGEYDTFDHTDCDDDSAASNPGLIFDGCDGLNNDCDQQTDEDGDLSCDDHIECNGLETCTLGVCVSGPPINDDQWVNQLEQQPVQLHYGGKSIPGLAMAPTGEYVMTGCDNDHAYAMPFDADGRPMLASEIMVSPQGDRVDKDGWAPVAMDPRGGFVVSWVDDIDRNIFFRRYDSAADPVGDIITVNQATRAEDPGDIAVSPSGDVLVAWTESRNGGNVLFRLFKPDGQALTNETVVTTGAQQSWDTPAVAMDSSGAFIIVWSGTGYLLDAKRFDSAGDYIDSPTITSRDNIYDPPSVAMAPDGRFVVGFRQWDHTGPGYVAIFDALGHKVTEREVASRAYSSNTQPDAPGVAVAMNADGNILAAWNESSGDMTYTLLDAAGDIIRDASVVEQNVCCPDDRPPAVAATQCYDNFVVGWLDTSVLFLADDNDDGVADQCCVP